MILDLSINKITKIEGIEALEILEDLWVNDCVIHRPLPRPEIVFTTEAQGEKERMLEGE